jgi:hypothetical protein
VTKKTARRVVTDQGIQAALKQPLPAGTRFEDTPLTEVAERLSQLSGVKIEVAGAEVAAAKVTADVSHLALVAALRRIVEPFSARMQVRLSATSSADGTMPTKVTIVIGGKAAVRKTARKEVKVK